MPITEAPPEVCTLLREARSEGMPRVTRLLREKTHKEGR
jgi:hypothetical protein